MKKILYIIIFIIITFPNVICASNHALVKIGDNYYDNLQEAIDNVGSKDTIKILSDIESTKTFNINKTVNINLNGNNIKAPEKVFLIEGGSLHLSGKGKIIETNPNYGAIMIKGSTNSNDINYSTLKVDNEVTLEGWSGIFINQTNSKAYGVLINISGKINAINDINGDKGIGIYVNGSIQNENNHPVININSGSIINATGTGLYLAGMATTNIDNAHIEAENSAISIKSGILNIKNGTFKCNGIDKTPTIGNNNGINPSGATIQIESNNGYKGNIEINILDGTLISKNSHVIYEYIAKGDKSLVNKINISGGTYKSGTNKSVFRLSDSFIDKHSKFIKGGQYTSNPDKYLIDGYTTNIIDNMYVVITNTMKEEILNNNDKKPIKIINYIIISILVLITMYLNKKKILKLIKQN